MSLRTTALTGPVLLLVGCTTLGDDVLALPEPSIRRVDPPVLDAEQQKRQDEVNRFLAQRYHDEGWVILDTTQTYLGDIIDWLDPKSVPGSEVTPPPPPEFELPPGVELQQTELDVYPELRGPSWSVPMFRPTFAPYVFGDVPASSVEDFLAKSAHGQPEGQDRLYGGIAVPAQNIGAHSFINSYDGKVEATTMSLLELAVSCDGLDPDTTLEQVGVTASRDRANFDRDDGKPAVTRIQVEFYTAGFKNIGNDKGGWDGMSTGFKPVGGAPYGPGVALMPMSTVGGATYDSRFEIRNIAGGWWISHNYNWLGYYPPEFFDVMTSEACEAYWYGEVFDRTPTSWTATDMGSGHFAAEGFGRAAYFRLPVYLDTAGVAQWPDGAGTPSAVDPACYTSTELFNLGPGFERVMYVGGPGGDSPGCN
ncbi:neprosin family prolyl endopeptidase [Polyangium fumosum]|nr:neprosin family prolyl endopeptidase [Polyangium fumosum]